MSNKSVLVPGKLADASCCIGMGVSDSLGAPGALWHTEVVDVVYKDLCRQDSLAIKTTCLRG